MVIDVLLIRELKVCKTSSEKGENKINRILYTDGLITLLTLVFGSASSNAQVRVDVRLQFGEPVRTFNPYYTDLAAFYNMPYDAIYEMHFARYSGSGRSYSTSGHIHNTVCGIPIV